jgi:hypothetical protein
MQTETINILDESFEVPVLTIDLSDLIDSSIWVYNGMGSGKEKRLYRIKINELIDIYNERRRMKLFNHI